MAHPPDAPISTTLFPSFPVWPLLQSDALLTTTCISQVHPHAMSQVLSFSLPTRSLLALSVPPSKAQVKSHLLQLTRLSLSSSPPGLPQSHTLQPLLKDKCVLGWRFWERLACGQDSQVLQAVHAKEMQPGRENKVLSIRQTWAHIPIPPPWDHEHSSTSLSLSLLLCRTEESAQRTSQ